MKKHTLKYIEEDVPKEIEETLKQKAKLRCEEDPRFAAEKWSAQIWIIYEEMFGEDEDAHDVYFTD